MPGRLMPLLLWLLPWPAAFASADEYLRELVEQARAQRLAERPEWHALLHYKPRLVWPGVKSLADDSRFFNAPDGQTNPQAELEATLAGFFSDKQETDKEQNPQCAFVARYRWLKQELRFDPRRLPEQPCRRFENWRTALNPHALTLIFPAAYLNNPASLYGHTLLRVDARDQDERTRLLAYAINYAALTDETSGLIFAVKGLFGGYPGVFSISPYYVKVTEYNDLENRDIWEYELNFTPEEIDRLLMHVWELGPIRFDYYFFDENCSYHLLSLFEVARPGLNLTDRFKAWAIPSDTVRAVTIEEGLLTRATYRPARSTWLKHRQRLMDGKRLPLAKELAQGKPALTDARLRDLPADEQARVLELAFEYLDYERLGGRRAKAELPPATSARLREFLIARSRLEVNPVEPVPTPVVRPDEGHGSARVGLGFGREDGRSFQELRLRAAYHDLLDPQEGYVRGAQIEFFSLGLRRTEGDDAIKVERFDPLDIASLAPRDELLKPVSWKVNIGWRRKTLADGSRPLVFGLNTGAGLAAEPVSGALAYGFVEGALDISGRYRQDYVFGIGPSIGLLADFSDRWRVNLFARALRYELGDVHKAGEVALDQRYAVTRNSALRLELARRREFDRSWSTAGVFWNWYF